MLAKGSALRVLVPVAVIAGVIAAFFAIHPGGASSSSRARLVQTATNPTLGKTVLVNAKGLTLYSLSAERHGKFICTDSVCLRLWTPVVAANGKKPTGVSGLGTVKRPDGRIQVAFKGAPLYTFSLDRKRGDVRGNGFKDVGIWRPAVVGSGMSSAPPPTTGSGGGYGGGYGGSYGG
jgi:predicted lipoprotein with Yx(FWY)xxD motif